MEKKLDGNYKRMLQAILKKSWRQHPTKQQLYGHLPPITKTIHVRQTRHCWRSKDEPISDIHQWTPSRGRAKVGRLARTYLQQLCADTTWKTSWERWTMETGEERGSRRSVLMTKLRSQKQRRHHTYIILKKLMDFTISLRWSGKYYLPLIKNISLNIFVYSWCLFTCRVDENRFKFTEYLAWKLKYGWPEQNKTYFLHTS